VIPTDQIELIIAAIRQPAIEQMIVQPGAPTMLHRHPRIYLHNHQRNTHHQQWKIDDRPKQNGAGVSTL
jgi:hypothetical protein